MKFYSHLISELLGNLQNNYGEENYDDARFGPYKSLHNSDFNTGLFIKCAKFFLHRYNYFNKQLIEYEIQSPLTASYNNFEGTYKDALPYFEYLYNILEQEECKKLLIKIIVYRILGYTKVKLPLNTPEYWNKLKEMDSLIEGNEEIDINFHHFKLKKINLQKIGYPVVAFFNSLGVLVEFVLEQYHYRSKDMLKQIGVQKGDIVIDAGACYGDTALYFACKTGVNGKVYSFEFNTDNIKVFRRNCALNPEFSKNIDLIEFPLWNKSDMPVHYINNGPASRVSFDKLPDASGTTRTKTIDDFADEYKVSKIDYIKMDIEGAELNALTGATATLKKHKPKLAICLYHSPQDFGTIPEFINNLNLGYKFHLGHYTIHQEETVLFATTQ